MDGLQIDERPYEKTYVPPPVPEKVMRLEEAGPSEQVEPTIYSYEPGDAQASSIRLPWGLSVLGYTFLVAGLMFVICGAGFGGALGGVVASHKHSESATQTVVQTATVTATVSSTVSATSTTLSGLVDNYSPLLPDQVNTTALDCSNKATVTSKTGDQYQLHCNTNYAGNDMVYFVAYSLDTCIEACSNYNTAAGETQCQGIMFNANLQQLDDSSNGNCWLKSLMANPATDGLPPSVGAVLLS